ncbi:aminoglycoside phosphotransferase family protein [Phytomonospora endophytica]|uniref:Streptomycin 6-kinase n=1 Tax=Phytomonospora endophytica TaxID=714109 RepID=A0A841FFK3_9ACTN|nr:aminoglycoside phosphotransferase family protein [Phytomonospora endophytica]MBB6033783.1 streptomycin 6-kinase [Phytomonospora endophytica]GIG64699.1 aminoglycoside O-phosphotransferase [Phytomonospora endophytica]
MTRRGEDAAALVPAAFARDTAARPGGPEWLAAFPDLAADLLDRWDLRVDGTSRHGHVGVMIPVRSADGDALALKVSRPSSEVDNQIAALAEWDERGTVRLAATDASRGALLLERLNADRSLDDLEPAAAVEAAARLLRRLSVTASPGELPQLAEHVRVWPERWVDEWEALGRPLPRGLLDEAGEACRVLAAGAGGVLVDHDLHYRNVLAAGREPWLAIDPRGVIGDPEFALGPLLWNRFAGRDEVASRLDRFVELAGLDGGKARGWTLVRAVDYFLWSTGAGLTWDPAACREIIGVLTGP